MPEQPTHIVTVLEGLKAEFPNATITYVPGTQFLRNDGNPVPDALLTTPDGKPGLKADYSESMGRFGSGIRSAQCLPAASSRTSISLTATCHQRSPAKKPLACTGRASSPLTETGDYLVGVRARWFRKTLDRRQANCARWAEVEGVDAAVGRAHLVKGEKAELSLIFGTMDGRQAASSTDLGEGQRCTVS